jgi:hypothetical protein
MSRSGPAEREEKKTHTFRPPDPYYNIQTLCILYFISASLRKGARSESAGNSKIREQHTRIILRCFFDDGGIGIKILGSTLAVVFDSWPPLNALCFSTNLSHKALGNSD